MAGMVAKLGRVATASGKYAQAKWPIFRKFAMVELTPPGPGDIPQLTKEVKQLVTKAQGQAWRNTNVHEALINFAVCFEIACWFFVGEVIGKRSFIGYNVPGATEKGVKI